MEPTEPDGCFVSSATHAADFAMQDSLDVPRHTKRTRKMAWLSSPITPFCAIKAAAASALTSRPSLGCNLLKTYGERGTSTTAGRQDD